jgi:glycosyltransferase involved in cell wall biosynthesis
MPGRSFRLYCTFAPECIGLPNEREPGALKIGIISSNLPKKGLEHFMALAGLAAHRRPEFEFLAIGPRNAFVERLEATLEKQSCNMKFTGYSANPVEALSQVNVVVSLSLVPESFGRTILEGIAAGRPVIAYEAGATPELVRHGKDGFLIPFCEYWRALPYLETLADTPNLIAEMGRLARARAGALFSTERFAAQLNAIYGQILDMRGPAGQRPNDKALT